MTAFVGEVAISLIFYSFVACLAAPLMLWVPESLPACGSLWQPVGADGARSDAPTEEFGDIEAWGPEASMPGCSGGLLAWLAGWLARLAGWLARLASWLSLAWLAGCSCVGCCWLVAAMCKVVSHARRSRRSADLRTVVRASRLV